MYFRLEGEKEGLKKVLTVKSKIDEEEDEEEEEETKSSEKRGKRVKKNESLGKKDKDDENEEDDGKREKDSIEQIVKEHIEKLGLTNSTPKVINSDRFKV
jgi:hypothetical protein